MLHERFARTESHFQNLIKKIGSRHSGFRGVNAVSEAVDHLINVPSIRFSIEIPTVMIITMAKRVELMTVNERLVLMAPTLFNRIFPSFVLIYSINLLNTFVLIMLPLIIISD